MKEQTLRTITLTLFAFALLYLLRAVLAPFLVAAILAYLAQPAITWLEQHKILRPFGVALVFFGAFLGFVLLVLLIWPLFREQADYLARKVPEAILWIQMVALPWLSEQFGLSLTLPGGQELVEMFKAHWQAAGSVMAGVGKTLFSSGSVVLSILTSLFIIPVVTFYFMRDWPALIKWVGETMPEKLRPRIKSLANEVDDALSGFLRGQLAVMVCLMAVYTVGLLMVRLDLSLLVGVLAGLVSFVPYLGVLTGTVLALIAWFLQEGTVWMLVGIAIVFSVGQVLEGFVLTPRLVGERIGLHPVAVIFFLLAGGELFGFVGILVALPVAAILSTVVRHLPELMAKSTGT